LKEYLLVGAFTIGTYLTAISMHFIFISGWVLLVSYLLLLGLYRYGWKKLPKDEFGPPKSFPKISIIIPARNEELSLPGCLQSIVNQEYPPDCFEILVIDDHSEDRTVEIAGSFDKTLVLSLSNYTDNTTISFKKKAINIGIGKAKGDIIFSTDADCLMEKNWLKSISTAFTNNPDTKIIAGPVCLNPVKGNGIFTRMFSAFQQIDFLMYQGITGGGIANGMHHLCNGANLAYKKEAFKAINGFSGNEDRPSGDDIFLMQKMVTRYPGSALYLMNQAAIVHTEPAQNIGSFFQQRIRWAGKSAGYSEKSILPIMFFVLLVNLEIILTVVVWIFNPKANFSGFLVIYQLLALLLIKILAESLLFLPVSRFFKQPKFWYWLPFLQPFHIAYTVSTAFLSLWGSYNWKGRRFKK